MKCATCNQFRNLNVISFVGENFTGLWRTAFTEAENKMIAYFADPSNANKVYVSHTVNNWGTGNGDYYRCWFTVVYRPSNVNI